VGATSVLLHEDLGGANRSALWPATEPMRPRPATFGYLAGAIGLSATFLFMTVPLAMAAVLGLLAVRTYPADAAAARRAIDAPPADARR
jgi:hypothetical protein